MPTRRPPDDPPRRAPIKSAPVKRAPSPESVPGRDTPYRVVKGGRAKRRNRIIALLCVAAVLAASYVALDAQAPGGISEWARNLYAVRGKGNGFPVALDTQSASRILATDTGLAVLSGDGVLFYNSTGRLVYDRAAAFAHPSLCASPARLLVFDRGGAALQIHNNTSVLWNHRFGDPIITAALGRNGRFIVVTRHGGTNVATFYGADFKELLTFSTLSQVSAAAVSPDGGSFSLAVADAAGGQYAASIEMFKPGSAAPFSKQALPAGTLVFALHYTDGGAVAAVGDNLFARVAPDGKSIKTVSYGGRSLIAMDVGGAGGTLLCLTGDSAAGEVLYLAADGAVAATISAPEDVRALALGNGALYVLASGELSRYALSGKLQKSWDAGADAAGVCPFAGGAAVLGAAGVTVYR